MVPVDFYSVLGVDRSASPGSIRRSYRQRALATHPDKIGGQAERFRLVVVAFETLISECSRAAYDQQLNGKAQNKTARCVDKHPRKGPRADRSRSPHVSDQYHNLPCFNAFDDGRRKNCKAPGQGPHKSERRVSRNSAQRLSRFLDVLQHKIKGGKNKEDRQELLMMLSSKLKAALLAHMQSTPMSFNSSEDEKTRNHVKENSIHAHVHGAESASDNESSSGSSLDTVGQPHWNNDPYEFALVPWQELDKDVGGSPPLITSQHRVTHAGNNSLPEHGSHSGPRNSAGVSGISSWKCANGLPSYRAKAHIRGISIKSRVRHNLETVISDHMVLVQVKETIMKTCGLQGLRADDDCELLSFKQCLKESVEATLKQGLTTNDPGFCTFYATVSARAFIGRPLCTPHTRSIEACIEQQHRLNRARDEGWDSLRATWLDLLLHEEPRISGTRGVKARLPAEASALLDEAYEQHAPQRARTLERQQHHKELRLARLAERQRASRDRMLRRFARYVQLGELILKAVERERSADQQKQKQKQALADKRMQFLKRKELADKRWQWLKRKDLTFEEIMHGPPL